MPSKYDDKTSEEEKKTVDDVIKKYLTDTDASLTSSIEHMEHTLSLLRLVQHGTQIPETQQDFFQHLLSMSLLIGRMAAELDSYETKYIAENGTNSPSGLTFSSVPSGVN